MFKLLIYIFFYS